jgi:hypothetical protein
MGLLYPLVGRNLEKETFFIIMKQLLKFFILLLLCMVLRNLQSVLPVQLTQIDLIFAGV